MCVWSISGRFEIAILKVLYDEEKKHVLVLLSIRMILKPTHLRKVLNTSSYSAIYASDGCNLQKKITLKNLITK